MSIGGRHLIKEDPMSLCRNGSSARFFSPIYRTSCWLAFLATFAPAFVSAQTSLPPGDAEAIYRRLEAQEAELQWLRSQVAGQTAESFAPPSESVPRAEVSASQEFETPGAPHAYFASANAHEMDSVLRRLDDLEKKAAAAAEKKPADGWMDVSSEKWTVKLGGHMQADFVHWANADEPPIPAQDYFEFRRLRLLADGTGYGVFDFRLQIDIEPEGQDTVTTPVTTIKDAYLTMHEIAWLQRFRIGNFFVPFSLEQCTNDTNNIFMERSIPTQGIFTGDREVGIAFYGINDAQSVTWTFGTFLDSISEATKERIDDNQGQRFSGRLTWLPYYDELSNGRYLIHTGVGVLRTNDQDNTMRFRSHPQIHEGPFLIDSGNFGATSSTAYNVELATVWGNISVQSEMFVTTVDRVVGDTANLYGAYVYLSYFLTGENRIYERFGQHGAQFARNVPFTNFFLVPGCFGSGAWEAKVRYSNLNLNELNRGAYNDVTVGMNWYWTDRIRVMFDWIHPVTTADTPFGARDSDLLAMRFDFNW
jgi:phosphate-selective porin OprO/OprP